MSEMKMSRRGFAKIAAALPFAAGAATQAMQQRAYAEQQVGRQLMGGFGQALGGMNDPNSFRQPKIDHFQAMRLAMADPDVRDEIVAECYARHRIVHLIDPDIDVHRSFSPMAKIAFQRQRNVARELESMTNDSLLGGGKLLKKFIQKVMWD